MMSRNYRTTGNKLERQKEFKHSPTLRNENYDKCDTAFYFRRKRTKPLASRINTFFHMSLTLGMPYVIKIDNKKTVGDRSTGVCVCVVTR
jgi:hypothetical protein